jgi:hypothetical protein
LDRSFQKKQETAQRQRAAAVSGSSIRFQFEFNAPPQGGQASVINHQE